MIKRMPGEYEAHECCYMIWPERHDNWRNEAVPAQRAFINVIREIGKFEPVKLIVSPKELENAKKQLEASKVDVELITIESDDAWARDICPSFVLDNKGDIIGIDWVFNAWGGEDEGLYYPWDRDEALPSKLLEHEGVKRMKADLVIEGGAIHVDGEGTLITTEECLLNKNRNPHLTKEEIEEKLKSYLGVKKIIWIPRGIFNDETNGHIDNIACFARPGVVLLAWEEDENDPQHKISKMALEVLERERDARGRRLEVIKLSQPKPIIITKEESLGVKVVDGSYPRNEGDRLAATYVNHYIANGGVILPVFGGENEENDNNAVKILERVYAPRKVMTVYAREILLGGGNIHCITQQRPKIRE